MFSVRTQTVGLWSPAIASSKGEYRRILQHRLKCVSAKETLCGDAEGVTVDCCTMENFIFCVYRIIGYAHLSVHGKIYLKDGEAGTLEAAPPIN